MNLEITKQIIHSKIDTSDPKSFLVKILLSSIELLSLEENDFSWSSWECADDAIKEIQALIKSIQNDQLPEQLDVSVLFAPTGPIQEVSLSSGWAEAFLRIAEKYDKIEQFVWKNS